MQILNITNMCKTYKNGKVALNNLSLTVNKGDFIGLLGVNGAGKSTLINILGDIVIKTSGKAVVNGYDFDTDKINFKRSIGIVPQETTFDPFSTAYEALQIQQGLFGLPFNKERIEEVLVQLGLADKMHTHARGLSGGMKRRLLVAKALIHNPEVIILDEPTAGVDIELRQQLWEFINLLNKQGRTIILTTHYLEEAQQMCNKIAIIHNGNMVAYEDKYSLLAKIATKYVTIVLNKSYNNDINIKELKLNKITDNTLRVDYHTDEDIGIIINGITASGYEIKTLKIKEPQLEEVFLALTKTDVL
ncbi:putative ABC transporter ATP-binding protein YadG [Candidatus Hepatincola sp. Pdp]